MDKNSAFKIMKQIFENNSSVQSFHLSSISESQKMDYVNQNLVS